jgi:drug/metabolite transporter superfamily protein YnfA
MYGLTRGTITLLGAAGAGLLVWLATQIDDGSTGGYWAVYGLIAAAGLTMALSQLLGGWTKWGWPRLSANVLLIAFVPTLIADGLVVLA